jgi:transglutaminase-like putative cysteine protease
VILNAPRTTDHAVLLRIDHETCLSYTEPVAETVIELRMAPPSQEDQTVQVFRLRTTPGSPTTSYRDGFGNRVDLYNALLPHREVSIKVSSVVRVHRRSAADRLAAVPWPGTGPACPDTIEYLVRSPLVDASPALDEFCRGVVKPEGTLRDAVECLVVAVRGRLKYEKKVTTARTKLSEALGLGRGVCQDFAHLFLGVARAWGVPARYVSGYISQPGEIATHAWCQVWAGPAGGWVDVDPTQGRLVGNDHVVTAVGRDYSDVPPNRGVWKGLADESIRVTVNVQPVDRVPPEWSDRPEPAVWSGQVQSQGRGRLLQQQVRGLFRQQQSQQQQ